MLKHRYSLNFGGGNRLKLRYRERFYACENERLLSKFSLKANSAFTLAEVLITLGIIGVVAAMTIPVLMTKIRNKQYQVAYRKAYSTLNQALKSANEDGRISPITNTTVALPEGPVANNFKVLSEYFAGVTTCFNNDCTKCWECTKGQSGQYNGNGCIKERPAFMDASGMQYYLYAGSEWPIIVDVNGFTPPNELGRDRYVLYFTNSRTKAYYPGSDIDIVYPWKDVVIKQRWCPSGDCPNTSRLFGNKGNIYDVDMDAGRK